MTNRYTVQGAQGEFQPGSNDLVQANQLGITSVEEMNELELYLLQQLYEEVLLAQLPNRVVQVADLKTWHRRWLGNVYDWAGQERSVNMSKGGFMFAAAPQIPRLLADFERSCLARWTPCHGMDTDTLAEAIAITHVEFILIHPFREGNGRTQRVYCALLAEKAGYFIDFESLDQARMYHVMIASFNGDAKPLAALLLNITSIIGVDDGTSAQT